MWGRECREPMRLNISPHQAVIHVECCLPKHHGDQPHTAVVHLEGYLVPRCKAQTAGSHTLNIDGRSLTVKSSPLPCVLEVGHAGQHRFYTEWSDA